MILNWPYKPHAVYSLFHPETAEKDSSLLKVLQQHRRRDDGKTYLGQNAIIKQAQTGVVLNVGDKVEFLS